VQSLPSLIILALPIGNKKSSPITSSGTTNSSLYIISLSRKHIGLTSLMADFSKPLASSTSYGAMTTSPGTEEYQEAKHYECWAATAADEPFNPLNTIEPPNSPPDIYLILAAVFTT